MKKLICALFIFSLSVSQIVFSADEHRDVGVVEHLGNYIPDDVYFYDSLGKKVNVKELVKKTPTVIAPVYFTCPNVCNLLQSSLSNIVPEIKLAPGKDYQILSVSFDENDTPDIASRKKDNYMAALENFPEDSWKFLTGDKDNIDKFMDSIGFKFRREGKDFIHSVALIILSPDGKIVRYVYGTRILPFDLTMAIVEAQKGEVGFSVKRVLSYCFSYDPNGKKYVFNVMKVSATIILAGVVTLFLVLTLTGKRKSTRGKDE